MSAHRIETLLDQLTLAEQVRLLSGKDFWSTEAIERLAIPSIKVTDGPNGARGGGALIGGLKAAAFPVGIALGATFNPSLVKLLAEALAKEVRSKGAQVSLAPTINIHRSVTNGRNFECYSEDPVLTAELAVAYITGLQDNGIAATPKHFVANDSEHERLTISSEVDERTLREIYLLPFEHAVKRARAWAIMTAYNKINGTYASENRWTLTEILREEWGFDGVAMSDWFGSHTTAETVIAGLDLEMPGPVRNRGDKLIAAVEAGEVPEDVVREAAYRMLKLFERVGALVPGFVLPEETADDRPQTRRLIRQAGVEAMVLLKNDAALPIDADAISKVAVIGPNAKVARIMGGGSAQLNPHYAISPWDGLADALGADTLDFAIGCTNYRLVPQLDQTFDVTYYNSPDFSGPVIATETLSGGEFQWFGPIAGGKVDTKVFTARIKTTYTARETGTHHIGAVSAGLSRIFVDGQLVANAWDDWKPGANYFLQGCDEVIGKIDLVAGQDYDIVLEFSSGGERMLSFNAVRIGLTRPLGEAEIDAAVAAAENAEIALVFAGRNGEWDSEGYDLPDITLPGRQDELIAKVAAANPKTIVVLQTGGPVEMPWLDAVAGVICAWYPGQEAGNSIADVLLGKANPGGKLPQTFPRKWADNPTAGNDAEIYPGRDGKVRYAEDLMVGYRHYDRNAVAPLFPFGFGLSYTRFALSDLAIEDTDFEETGAVTVTVKLSNLGEMAGTEVVQLYVADPEASVVRPPKELRAFRKVALKPGETQSVTLTLDARAFAFFDTDAHLWRLEAGRFDLLVGTSSADIALMGAVQKADDLTLPV